MLLHWNQCKIIGEVLKSFEREAKYKIEIYIFLKSGGPGPPWVPPNSAPATNGKHILFCTATIHKDYKFFERISTFDDNYYKEDFIDDYLI